MSFESNLAKKKKRKGIGIIIIGIIILGLLTFPYFSYLSAYGLCRGIAGILTDCEIYAALAVLGIMIGLTLIVIGIIFIAQKNKLSINERRIKNEMDKDEKIKELEKRLERVEEDKTKSESGSSSEGNPENS